MMEKLESEPLGDELTFCYSQTIDLSTSSSKPVSAKSFSSNIEDLSPLSTHSVISTSDIETNSTQHYKRYNSYSFDQSQVTDVCDRPSVLYRKSSTYSYHLSCTGTDSDDDDVENVFGGVYCGTVKRASIKLNNSFKSYSKSRGTSEVKPLLTEMQDNIIQAAVNDISKLYLEEVNEGNSCENRDMDSLDEVNDSYL